MVGVRLALLPAPQPASAAASAATPTLRAVMATSVNVSVARYLVGVVALAIVVCSVVLTAVVVRRRVMPDWAGAPARLAESVIGTAVLIGVLEIIGTVGLFGLIPVVVAYAAVAAAAFRLLGAGRRIDSGRRPRRPDRLALVMLATAAISVVAVFAEWGAPTLKAYDLGVHVVDSMWYHLPWAASFAQTGQITPLRFTDVEFLTAFYPANAEMVHGLGIVLLARDTLTPVINFLWLGLAFLAAYCVGRARGVGAICVLGLALVMATPMIDLSQPGSADNDILGVYLVLASAALLLAAAPAEGTGARPSRGPYLLAAIAAGLAAGTKLTFLVSAVALSVGVVLLALRARQRGTAAAWVIAAFVAGGFWYVRNLIAVGNPLPWTSLGILATPAPPQQGHTTFAVAHYLFNGRILHRFFEPALASGLGRWWYAIVALALVGPLLCLLPRSRPVLRMLALVALASLVAYLFTPNSAMGPAGDPLGMSYNVRYAAPGLSLAFVLLPLASSLTGPRRRALLTAVLAAVFVATIAEQVLWPGKYVRGAVVVGAVAAVIAATAVMLRAGPLRLPRWRLAALPIAGVVVLAGAGAAAGYAWQRHYLRLRYAYRPGISHLSKVWELFRRIHHARVGLVGTYGSYFGYPLMGVDDSNTLLYVAAHGPHGSFTPIRSCRAWRAAVNAGHFQYLVTTPRRDFWDQNHLFPSPEDAWTITDPAAHVVYHRHALGQPIGVYRIRGRLDPAACR